MLGKTLSPRGKLMLGVAAVCLLLLLYTYVSYRQHQINANDKTIPSWAQMKEGVAKFVQIDPRSEERWIVADAWATLGRLFMGLFISVAGAIVFGLLMGVFPAVEAVLYPPLAFIAKCVPTAMIAVFFALVGTDTKMFVSMIVFGVMPTLTQTVFLAVKDVPDELVYKAYTLGASRAESIWNVIFRHIMPKLLDAIRLSIGPAMVYLIAAEMLVADEGFGYRIRLEMKKLNMDIVYPYIAILAAFGFGIDFALIRLRRFAAPWADSGEL